MLRIGIVAGEASGDLLGEDLIAAIRALVPDVHFEGVGGPRMRAAGCHILESMDLLSVMGLVEVLGRLPRLLALRRKLIRHFCAHPPDVFIGIDAPDFNLTLERHLRVSGIPTVHYVSPSVWAWRRNRLRNIARSTDLMLTLLPFETAIYESEGIPVRYVGHPLATRIPARPDREAARRRLGLPTDARIIAVMPGSREGELQRMAAPLLQAAGWCHERREGLVFASSVLTQTAAGRVESEAAKVRAMYPDIRLHCYVDQAHEVLEAADYALLTSGTVTLEALLYNLPMVAGYRMNALTYRVIRSLVTVEHATLPNLLAGQGLVSECLQQDCVAERLGAALCELLDETGLSARQRHQWQETRARLELPSGTLAAEAVLSLCRDRRKQDSQDVIN